jgi:hypothetical protein
MNLYPRRLGLLAVSLAFGVLWAGCSSDETETPGADSSCVRNAEKSCECPGGARGTRTCRADGTGFDACHGCAGGDGGGLPACSGCDGCCGAAGCVPLADEAAATCGKGGVTCRACNAGSTCAAGDCVVTTTQCSATAGATFCCLGTQQVDTLAQDTNKCGTGGNECVACENGVACEGGGCSMGIDENAQFKIRVKSITALATNTGGSSWDGISSGLPELYAEFKNTAVTIDGWNVESAPGCVDTITCVPTAPDDGVVTSQLGAKGVMVVSGRQLIDGLDITVWDDDATIDDSAGTKTGFKITTFQPSYKTGPFGQVAEVEFELFK